MNGFTRVQLRYCNQESLHQPKKTFDFLELSFGFGFFVFFPLELRIRIIVLNPSHQLTGWITWLIQAQCSAEGLGTRLTTLLHVSLTGCKLLKNADSILVMFHPP